MARSIERVLEEAHQSGDLKLNGRKLKDFPSTDKYDLNDTVFADLSRNRFAEVPNEITNFWCLEHLNLHHNAIRSVPDSVTFLQSLVYLDISHNQLTSLPSSVCHLPLEILLVSNNKLQCLPGELGFCKTLTELDVSCNQLNRLPPQLGLLNVLRSLNIRSNLLLEIPIELTYLKLTRLDISRNRIASLPVELKNMSSSLEILRLTDNPLMAPPAVVCTKGMVHVFKWLESRCAKQDKKQGIFPLDIKNGVRKFGELPKNQQFDTNNIDWTYLNIDPSIQMYSPLDEKFRLSRNIEKRSSEPDISDKNGSKYSFGKTDLQNVAIQKNLGCDVQNEKGRLQTYREYKESLRLQRTVDSVYKCPNKETNPITQGKPVTEVPQETKPLPKPPSMKPPAPPAPKKVTVKEKILVLAEKANNPSSPRPKTARSSNEPQFDKMQFTMRREFEKAKEEAELIKQLRSTIESRLKVVLPENLSSALCDGVVLCHFANHIMPHSVASIHVPSPTVPILTTARSRRNVDNFLEACRKIGIEEKMICCAGDIVEGKGLAQVAITVSELLHHSKSGNQEAAI